MTSLSLRETNGQPDSQSHRDPYLPPPTRRPTQPRALPEPNRQPRRGEGPSEMHIMVEGGPVQPGGCFRCPQPMRFAAAAYTTS